VHVGADGLRSTRHKWTDTHLYTHVLNHSGLAAGTLRLAFVEPIEEKARGFWIRVGWLPVNKSQVSLWTAMLDGSCPKSTRSLFRISPAAMREFNMSSVVLSGWVSQEKGHAFKVLKHWVSSGHRLPCYDVPGDCREGWERFARLPNLTDYYEELLVPCYTLADLLTKLGTEVADLAMLVVDAEELDQAIIQPLASDPSFRPGFIMWEGKYQNGGPLHDLLLAQGFQLGSKQGNDGHGGDAPNTVAVLPYG